MGIGPTRGMCYTLEGSLGRWHRGPALIEFSHPDLQSKLNKAMGIKLEFSVHPSPVALPSPSVG